MEITFSPQALADREYWKESGRRYIMERITALLNDMTAHPFTGTGKPEKLKYELSGKWSRRIDHEHRIIYSVREAENDIYVLTLRYHYSKQ